MKFQELKQDQMTVNQYEVKFTQLSRYTGKLVSEEEDKTKSFVRGLSPEIKANWFLFNYKFIIRLWRKQ